MFFTKYSSERPKGMYALLALGLIFVAFAMLPDVALAQSAEKLPYEKGISVLQESMNGTVPFIISLVGIIGCGAMLIFGGEISGFMRTMVFIVLVVAVIVQASSVVELLGGKKQGAPGQVHAPGRHPMDRNIA